MKKTLLITCLVLVFGIAQAQTLLSENFDVFPATWTKTNQSQPVGIATWRLGGNTLFGGGFNGGATSFVSVNFNSIGTTASGGTISDWLITPVVSLKNGDVIKFYTRVGANFSTIPDRLELRLSSLGAATVMPSTGNEDLGSFITLLLSVNPNLAPSVYPVTWTEFSYTVFGLPTATDCKLAFRYYVTNGGADGTNGNAIGLDALTINRTLSTDSFFSNNFAVFPNPATTVLNITSSTSLTINTVQITDMNGRIVKEQNQMTTEINISELKAGVYFLKVITSEGTGTTKIIKS